MEENNRSDAMILVYTVGILLCSLGGLVWFIGQPAIVAARRDRIVSVTEDEVVDAHATNVVLSIVVPAYNEEDRLPVMLTSALEHLARHSSEIMDQCSLLQQHQTKNGIVTRSHAAIGSKKPTTIIEVLVVSDGSTDDTAGVVRRFQAQQQTKKDGIVIRLLELSRNSGKGAAVQAGMLRTRGNVCLMADADGATDFGPGITAVLKTYKEISDKHIRHIVVFGSRAHLEKASTATRSPLRSVLMVCFHWFVAHLCDNTSIRDTQCGFKLFSRPAAMALFTNLHLQRWAFDTELIVIVGQLTNTDCPFELTEVSVPWHEVDGSKLDTSKFALAWNSITMLRDMICVRACYYLGIWKLKS